MLKKSYLTKALILSSLLAAAQAQAFLIEIESKEIRNLENYLTDHEEDEIRLKLIFEVDELEPDLYPDQLRCVSFQLGTGANMIQYTTALDAGFDATTSNPFLEYNVFNSDFSLMASESYSDTPDNFFTNDSDAGSTFNFRVAHYEAIPANHLIEDVDRGLAASFEATSFTAATLFKGTCTNAQGYRAAAAATPVAAPTLSVWGLGLLSGLMAGAVALIKRRRKLSSR